MTPPSSTCYCVVMCCVCIHIALWLNGCERVVHSIYLVHYLNHLQMTADPLVAVPIVARWLAIAAHAFTIDNIILA